MSTTLRMKQQTDLTKTLPAFQAIRDTKMSPQQTTAYLLTSLHKVSPQRRKVINYTRRRKRILATPRTPKVILLPVKYTDVNRIN